MSNRVCGLCQTKNDVVVRAWAAYAASMARYVILDLCKSCLEEQLKNRQDSRI